MRRSIDFGTLTGSLSSTLKSSSRSNGNSNEDGGTLSSSSPGGGISRYGTIAGVPTSSEHGSNGHIDTFSRPRSALSNSNGGGGGMTRRAGRGHFGLAGLFSVGQQYAALNNKDSKDEGTLDDGDNNPRNGGVHHSQSATDVNEVDPVAQAARAPSTPDTPADREDALMQAVQAAKAKDEAWEITVVVPTHQEGLFLGYDDGNRRKNRSNSKAGGPSSPLSPSSSNGTTSKLKRTPSSNGSTNQMFGAFGLSGRARRFLGRTTGDKYSPTTLSTTAEKDEAESITSSPAALPTTPGRPHPTTMLEDRNNEDSAGSSPAPLLLTPTSPAKRHLESNEDIDESIQASLQLSHHRHPGTPSASFIATSTPAAAAAAALGDIDADPHQLLVLYVTTGSSSLTLYRKIGQLIKLDYELRKYYASHMPTGARPSLLSSSPSSSTPLTTPSNAAAAAAGGHAGHTRRKSVLASITRTFTSPTLSRRTTPNIASTVATTPSATSIAEEVSMISPPIMSSRHTSATSMTQTVGGEGEEEGKQQASNSPLIPTTIQDHPVLSSQLSNLSDYLTSLSCISTIRSSKQWNIFFKPTREDHESSRLEPVLPSASSSNPNTSKGRRLKRMKSDTGLHTRSPLISPSNSISRELNPNIPPETLDRKEVRIDDSGIDIGISSGYKTEHPARDGSAGSVTVAAGAGAAMAGIGHGHPTESSMDSIATTSASASMMMKREVSTGTNTSVSAMSVFIEHTEGDDQEVVGDPEVLEYMERLRQDSEARHANKEAFKSTATKKVSKASDLDYVPPTPTSPTSAGQVEEPKEEDKVEREEQEEERGRDTDGEYIPGTLPPPYVRPPPQPYGSSFYSPSNAPVLAALEESIDTNVDDEGENAPLPPLSGATAVGNEEVHSESATPALTYDASPHQQSDGLLSPISAMHDSESSPSVSLQGKKKKSASSLRRRRKSSAANTSLISHQARSRKTSIRIEDFEILRVLGKGCAGKVLLARLKDMTTVSTRAGGNNALYAIKAIHKHHVLAHRELAHTLTEQSILRKMVTETPNPFVVMMRWSFQDKDNLFLVLDFHPGGDLATQLSRWGRLGKDRTRFYAAEIIEGLESLHRAGVIYRDLKPENILLAADGHIVLTDFGLSKQFYRPPMNTSDSGTAVSVPHWLNNSSGAYAPRSTIPWVGKSVETTTTFCGTAEYLAPEVLLGHAYSYPVDMWSLGTMIYEMLLGVTPFYNEDHGVMYRRVLHEPLNFGPRDFIDADTRALLRGLLQKEPEFRMTTSRVKRAKYFEAIDWQFVSNKRYIPPFIPSLSPDDPADTQNFEECFLTMDLGFVDEKDTEEIEAKAKTSGKEPDKAVDEEGRDVFADYSFDGAWADPDSEDDEIEEESEEGSDEALEEDEEQDVASEVPQEDTCLSHTPAEHTPPLPPTAGNDNKAASPSSTDNSANAKEHEMSANSTSSIRNTTIEADQHEAGVLSGPASTDAVLSSTEENKTEEQVKGSDAVTGKPSNTHGQDVIRNSVELPKLALHDTTTASEAVPRVSVDQEEWDLVEAMGSDEVADNGRKGPRRRLMAGTNLFAKGVVDKYKMQIKPLSRVPTPTRSYTSRGPINRLASGSIQPPRSAKTSNQLSPSPSIGGMSESPSSAESSEQTTIPEKKSSKGPGRRLVTPRLLRASSEWMSSSLPSSPTPRFRMKRNTKGTAPEAMTPPPEENQIHAALEPGFLPTTPKSVDSVATLPVENAGGFGLQPLTRQLSRNRGSPGSDKSRNGSSLREEGGSVSSISGDRQGPKLKTFVYSTGSDHQANE